MCGIVAISAGAGGRFELARMLDSIRHRGPDGSGVFVSESADCHLGHVRLSIIDLSAAGSQPMFDASGRYVIVYNGEIYNFPTLKRELERDGAIAWKSGSDTEVILEGYARLGAAFLERLNGIFALAIYDKRERTVSVLRDPLGIKPLFFTAQHGNVYFASELKALLALPDLQRTLRRQSLAEQLAFMYVPEPHTVFEEFRKLERGRLATYRDGVLVSSQKLFGWMDSPISFANEAETVEAFAAQLSGAVQRQLISDAPVSVMLSGGLDSSAIAFEAARAGGVIRNAYTIAVSAQDMTHDRQSDDLHYARIVAERLGLKLEVIPAQRDFVTLLPSLARFMEDGISDPAAINTYLICKAARDNGIKVILTGQGADEYLGGYRRYVAHRAITRMPAMVRRLVHVLGGLMPSHVPGRFNALARRVGRVAKLAGQTRSQRLLGLYTWAQDGEISSLFAERGLAAVGDDLLDRFERHAHLGDIDAMMRVDHHYDLLSLNLTYTDRLSMAASVEARVPFLDFELVRLMSSIPLTMKIRGGTSKYVLKKAMELHLPREVVYRQKAGFALPIRSWFRRDNEVLRHYFDKARLTRQGIFDADALRALCTRQFAGDGDHGNLLFSMLCIQVWLDGESALP